MAEVVWEKFWRDKCFCVVCLFESRQNATMLNQVILSFVKSLPDTIRKDLCGILIAYAGRDEDFPMLPDEVEESTWRFLSPDRFAEQVSVIYVCSAILDHMLEHFASPASDVNLGEMKERAAKTGNVTTMKIVAGHGLRKKHFQQAYDTWVSLRETVLSPDAIFHFVEHRELFPTMVVIKDMD